MQSKLIPPTFPCVLVLVIAAAIVSACQRSAAVRMHESFSLGDFNYSIESAKLESQPARSIALRPPRPDWVYLIVSYRLTNNGDVSIDVGLPPFELRTEDGRRFQPDLLVSLLHPVERAEQSGSLGAMAEVLNTQLHPGLSGTYEVAFSLPKDAATVRLYLTASRGWLSSGQTIVSLN